MRNKLRTSVSVCLLAMMTGTVWAEDKVSDEIIVQGQIFLANENPGADVIVFDSEGPSRNRDSLRLNFDLQATGLKNSKWSGFIRYTGDIASDAQDHIVRAGVSRRF